MIFPLVGRVRAKALPLTIEIFVKEIGDVRRQTKVEYSYQSLVSLFPQRKIKMKFNFS